MSGARLYSTLVVFGNADVSSTAVFAQLFEDLAREMDGFGVTLKVSGYVAAEGRRNVAPRASLLSDRTLGRWLENLTRGMFQFVSIYDSSFSETSMPRVYAGFTKLWGYVGTRYSEETKVGATCNVTVAVEKSFLPSTELNIESRAKVVAEKIEAVYGFIEREVPWVSQVHHQGGDRFINWRWRDVAEVDYRAGRFSMKSVVPRLYWGNILRPAHFRQEVPREAVGRMEKWSEDRIYLRFLKDPQADPTFQEDISGRFNLIS